MTDRDRRTRHAWHDTGEACVFRVDHGAGEMKTFDECRAAVDHPLNKLSADRLKDVIAYLSAQVVGYRHSENAEAKDAMTRILLIARDYERRTR